MVYLELEMTGDYPACPRCGDEQNIIILPSVPGSSEDPRWIRQDLKADDWYCPACYVKLYSGTHRMGWVYKQGVWYEEAGAEEVRS